MSHHHMLPPIIYTPPPKPKRIEKRKSRIQARPAGEISDTDEIDETGETTGLGPPVPLTNKLALNLQIPIEGPERKPHSTRGFLSEATLTALLVAQEIGK
jgi:hypothetical protein